METTHLTCRLAAAWMALGGLLGAQTTPDPPRSLCPDASPLAAGVELVRGRFVPGSQPDGNSVVLRAPGGLVVIDTGRHAEHTWRSSTAQAGPASPSPPSSTPTGTSTTSAATRVSGRPSRR